MTQQREARVGRGNMFVGLAVMAGFMAYGFLLIYLRDFAAGKEAWIASSHTGAHFEARLAHVHGNLFALLNIVFGFLLLKLPIAAGPARWISILALTGLLMPLGILGEVYLGLPPYLVLVGAVAILSATVMMALAVLRMPLSKP